MAANSNAYDYLAKIITLGNSGVGKTSLLLRFCEEKFSTSYITTVGAEYYSKIIDIKSKKMMLQTWDTSGQERFRTIAPTFIKKAMGVVLVYAVNDRKSFEDVSYWMEQIRNNGRKDVCIILVGSKIDMPDRAVEFEEGKNLADSVGIAFFETSAKEGTHVNEALQSLALDIKEKIIDLEAPKTEDTTMRLKPVPQKSKEGGKCCN